MRERESAGESESEERSVEGREGGEGRDGRRLMRAAGGACGVAEA